MKTITALSERHKELTQVGLQINDMQAFRQAVTYECGHCVIFEDDLQARKLHHQSQLDDLSDCISRDRLTFEFQPVVLTATGGIAGLEVLARWVHPTDGLIDNEVLLSLAAEIGCLVEIDKAAVRAAVRMKKLLACAGYPEVRLGFNASMKALCDESYIRCIVDGISGSGCPPSHFVIEVLEAVRLYDGRNSPLANIQVLAQYGLEVLLDDFGSGYAGVAHLFDLPLNGVKLDRSIVRNVSTSTKAATIVSCLVDLCHKLGLSVVAEGVEDQQTRDLLEAYGARFLQGFLLFRPMEEEKVLSTFRGIDQRNTSTMV